MSQHARETKAYHKLVELNYLQAEIVIIGPKPHQSTHFLYTIENSPMDFSRESQTSTNTSELDHQYRWEIARSLNDCGRFAVDNAWFSKYI